MHSITMAVAPAAGRLAAVGLASGGCGRPLAPAATTQQRRRQRQRAAPAAAAGPRSGSGRKGGKAAAPVQAPEEAAAAELAAERQLSAGAAAALSEQQQQQLDALAEAISARLEAIADSDDWSPGAERCPCCVRHGQPHLAAVCPAAGQPWVGTSRAPSRCRGPAGRAACSPQCMKTALPLQTKC